MSNEDKKSEIARDRFEQEIVVGDYVVYSAAGGSLQIGVVKKITPKGFTMNEYNPNRGGFSEYKTNRARCLVLKYDTDGIKKYMIKHTLLN
jgi:hypothetical protein